MNSKKVSIIILNYNWKNFNDNCLDSVLIQTYTNFEIIFVDNDSIDWSLEIVEKKYYQEIKKWKIKIVKSDKNLWFDWWNNLWVKFCDKKSEYICLLNNDTIVEWNWLEELVKWINYDNKIWAVGSLILNKWHEKDDYDLVFQRNRVSTLSLFWWVSIKNNSWNYDIIDVPSVCWCSIMYKKELLDKPFEDYYFAYAEEQFLCFRLIYMWYSIKQCTKSIVHHFWSWTAKTMSDFCLFHGEKNDKINHLIFLNRYNIVLFMPLYILKLLFQCISPAYKRPFYILKFKLKAWKRIIKNRWLIRETKIKEIEPIKKISEFEFLQKMPFKVVYFGKNVNLIYRIWWAVLNAIFEIYWAFVKLINHFIDWLSQIFKK